jgi:outer membrane protein
MKRPLVSPILLALFCGPLFGAPAPSADPAGSLTLAEARSLALKTHPRITVAELRALVAQQVVTETRSAYYPTLSADAEAVGTGEDVTRLSAAGTLSNSQIFNRVGVGAVATMLLTDFGRTANLAGAARLQARAAEANLQATRAQLLLDVDAAYYGALEARAVKAVAAQTLAARQLLLDRTSALAKNQLKSELDVRFARVGLDEARLLADQAEKDWQSALATLANILGQRTPVTTLLIEEPAPASDLPSDPAGLEDEALRQRPELAGQRFERDAAQDLARAAQDARLPTVSAAGTAGTTPIGQEHFERNYAAAGVNVNVPLFAGGLYAARQREAELQASGADAVLRDAENNVVRDVQIAWLEAGHAFERIALSASLLENADAALALARARFEQGLSSIVELNQAELTQISAAIGHTNAEYDYRLRRDILAFQTGTLN